MSNVIFGVPNIVNNVREFHIKYGLGYKGPVRDLTRDQQKARLEHLREEISELIIGFEDNDREAILDACVDIVYVAIGTAYHHGFDFNEAWRRVHEANMKKIRGSTKRSAEDVIKPEGWKEPNLKDLIK